MPRADTWGQAEPWRATGVSPPYLFTPFLIALLVRAPPRATGGFASRAGGGWDTEGLALGTAQLPEMFLQRLVNPQPTAEPGSSTCRVWETNLECPAVHISALPGPPVHQAVG